VEIDLADGCQLVVARSTAATAAYRAIPKALASMIPAHARGKLNN
jgi:hypothetical protein